MEIKKTDADAEAFAANLADEGDAGVFRNLWARGEHGMIRGHFPAFVADETETPVVDVKPAKSTSKSKK